MFIRRTHTWWNFCALGYIFLHPISFTHLLVRFKPFIIWIQVTQGPVTFSSQARNSCWMFGYISISITRFENMYVTTWLIFLVCIALFPSVCLTTLPVLFLSLLICHCGTTGSLPACRSLRSSRASTGRPGPFLLLGGPIAFTGLPIRTIQVQLYQAEQKF